MKKLLNFPGRGEVSKQYVLNPSVSFWNSPLLNGLPFKKLGNGSHGNLQLGDIAYFVKFSNLGKKKCLITWRQLNFLLGPTDPKFCVNQNNNNTDFAYKYFLFFFFYNSSNMMFFFKITLKYIKNKNLVHLTLLNHRVKRSGWFHL